MSPTLRQYLVVGAAAAVAYVLALHLLGFRL